MLRRNLFGIFSFLVLAMPFGMVHAATNLLTNPGLETGDATGWTASGASVRSYADGCPDWPSGSNAQCVRKTPFWVYEGEYSLHFSYTMSSSYQTVDLTGSYSTAYLDTAPDIVVTDHVTGTNYLGGGCGDKYRLRVILKNGSGGTVASYDTGTLTAIDCSWHTLTYTFSGYGAGVRSVYFERSGQDSEYVQGGYGSAFDGASLIVEDPSHTLTYAAGSNGSLTGDVSQTVADGGDGTAVTAVPSTGYHFVDWSDSSTDNPRTDTNVTADASVTANFAIDTHALSYVAGAHGSLTGTASQTVNYGGDGSAVTAVADTGYHFSSWSDANTDNPRTDTNVTADVSVTANFAIDTHTLTYSADSGGSLSGTTSQTVDHGGDGTAVTAIPSDGYHFVDWSDSSTDNPRTDTNVTADVSVTANFEEDEEEEDVSISNIEYNSTEDSITIRWKTNRKADSKVLYGISRYNLDQEEKESDREKMHKIVLNGLRSDTRYYFHMRSKDANGNEDESKKYSIKTKRANSVDALVVTSVLPKESREEAASESQRETQDKLFSKREYVPTQEAKDRMQEQTVFPVTVSKRDDQKVLSEIRFRIVDASGAPVGGTPVTLFSDPRSGTTDENGIVVFSDVPAGNHHLVLNYNGEEIKRPVAIKPKTEEGQIQMELVTVQVGEPQVTMPFWGWIMIAVLGLYAVFITVMTIKKKSRGKA